MKYARLFGIGFARFMAGAFICNGIPHYVSGLQGQGFPSPFADPPGYGESPALVNVYWGLFNLIAGALLLKIGQFKLGVNWQSGLFLLGTLGMSSLLAPHFEEARYGGHGKPPSTRVVPGFGPPRGSAPVVETHDVKK